MLRRVGLVALASLLAASCGSGDSPTVQAPEQTTTTTTNAAAAGATTTALDGEGPGSVAFTTSAATPAGGYGHLVGVRHAAHEGFHRIVFEFRDAVPGARAEFTERPVVQDGSGDEIAVSGDRVVLVRFEPASGFDLEAGRETYTGARRFEVEQPPVVEVVRVGDFEANLDWAVGVDDGSRLRLFALSSPPRVVLDVNAVADA